MNEAREFGFYPERWNESTELYEIRTLSSYEDALNEVENSPQKEGNWFFAPLYSRRYDSPHGSSPVFSERVFSLPKTHSILIHGDSDEREAEFAIWCMSLFTGYRLTTEQAGFLDNTPVKPAARMVDFVMANGSMSRAVAGALNFYRKSAEAKEASSRIGAAIHALFLSKICHQLSFESFIYLYISLEACFKTMQILGYGEASGGHAARINWMCEQFSIQTPNWAAHTPNKGSAISSIRNNTFHEGLFYDRPLGFSTFREIDGEGSQSTILEMQNLVSRLTLGIIFGGKVDYVTSGLDSRQIQLLELPAH